MLLCNVNTKLPTSLASLIITKDLFLIVCCCCFLVVVVQLQHNKRDRVTNKNLAYILTRVFISCNFIFMQQQNFRRKAGLTGYQSAETQEKELERESRVRKWKIFDSIYG